MNEEKVLREINEMKSLILRMEQKLSWYESESLKESLNKNEPIVFDLKQIGYEKLKELDNFKLTYCWDSFENHIAKNGNGEYLFEKVFDLLPSDEVVRQILNNYQLNDWQIKKVEMYHNISVYILISTKTTKKDEITNDMDRMGYFKASEKDIVYGDMRLLQIKFEPKTQNDETDKIKSIFDFMYHLSPSYNEESILKEGLLPKSSDSQFLSHPNRVYLMNGDVGEHNIITLGRHLCEQNKNTMNDGSYTLFQVNLQGLPENVRFYKDPNAIIGAFTETVIPPTFIQMIRRYNFR